MKPTSLLPSAKAKPRLNAGKVIVWITVKVDHDDDLNETRTYAYHFKGHDDIVQSPFAFSCTGAADAGRAHVKKHFGAGITPDLRFRI